MSQAIFFEEDKIDMELIDASNGQQNPKTTRSRVRKKCLTWYLELTNKWLNIAICQWLNLPLNTGYCNGH